MLLVEDMGAAAVAPDLQLGGIGTQRKRYKDIADLSTVYAAELRGLFLALRIVLKQGQRCRSNVFTLSRPTAMMGAALLVQ